MGDVMGDLSSRRGRILGMGAEGGFQVVRATVPLAELYKYSTNLRSLTQGRGIHEREFSCYEEVPRDITEKVIGAAFEVYRELGYGFLEKVYKKAMVHELSLQNVKCDEEPLVPAMYKGVRLLD